MPLQHAVDKAVIKQLNPGSADVSVNLRRFPYPPYNDDPFVVVLQNQFPYIIMLSFVFCALHIVKSVVHEKERKLKVRSCFAKSKEINLKPYSCF